MLSSTAVLTSVGSDGIEALVVVDMAVGVVDDEGAVVEGGDDACKVLSLGVPR